MNYRWIVNGQQIKRNPDNYEIKPLTPNVTYAILSSGRQTRTQARQLLSANVLTLNWHNVDESLRRYISTLTQNSGLSQLAFTGTKPVIAVWAYLDTVDLKMSADLVDSRLGQGFHRRDLEVTGNTDGPYYHSFYTVPPDVYPSATYIQNSFLGPTMSSFFDTVPNWSGYAWKQTIIQAQSCRFSNLGTAEWSPYIRVTGPFSSLTLNMSYEDVDGTGAGVNFNWVGNALGTNDYLVIDTASMRVFLAQGSPTNWGNQNFGSIQFSPPTINEVYTFHLYTASDGQPFPYWPPAPMGDFYIHISALSNYNSLTTLDYSNNGLETFRYR